MNNRQFLVGALISTLSSVSPLLVSAQVHEFDLANGIHVIVNPVPEAEDVGVETFHEVGFVDEPESMVQSSHLLEHLVCYAPGAGFEAKAAMEWLNKKGMANAETMPDSTHYDYASKAENLEKILEIESARLKQTSFDPQMIGFEAKRVYQETDFVENNPQAGMLKHAFMALSHAWKYKSKTALVRGGLDNMDPGKLLKFYQTTYRPKNLTIAITGKTTLDEVKPLIEKHFGNLSSNHPQPKPLDWSQVAAHHTIGWDSQHRAVCVAWNPPKNKQDCVRLSLLSAVVMQKLANDPTMKNKTEMVMCSNNMWMLGDLPLFVYAMAKPDQDLDEIEKLISETFEKELKASASSSVQMIKSFGFQYDFQRKQSTWPRMQQQAKMVQKMGRSEAMSLQLVLLQDALVRCSAHRLLGDDPDQMITAIKETNKEDLVTLVDKTVSPKNQHVVHIVPQD